jgi:hypothetical protein
MKLSLMLMLMIVLPGCSNNQQEKNDQHPQTEVYDLNESTNIILSLLKKEELHLILDESENNKEKIDTLLKNFSPSEMAFEAEVLSQEKPVVIFYFDPTENNDEIMAKLTELATKYNDVLKFVKIDREKLFKITEQGAVDVFPTLMIIHNRAEVIRFEKPDLTSLETELGNYIKT